LDQFDPLACKFDYGLDQSPSDSSLSHAGPNVHAHEQPLMSLFLSLSDQQPSDTDEFRIMENSKRCRTAKPFREKSQRLGIFSFECAAECFWVASKPFQSNVSIQ